MLKELIRLASTLDTKGLLKEADALDAIIRKMASWDEFEDFDHDLHEIDLGFDSPAKIKSAKHTMKIVLDHPRYDGFELSEVGEDEDAFDPNEGKLFFTASKDMTTDPHEVLEEIVTFLQLKFNDMGIRLVE
jgi:hypothetical protein